MSRFRDGAEIRKKRVDMLINIIERNYDVHESKVKALFMRQTGLTLKRINEYLEELEIVGIIERKDDRITYLLDSSE